MWREILANVLNIRLNLPVTEQGPGYGSAMLAMVGAGAFENVEQCANTFFKVKATVEPDQALVALYADRYEKYRKIYPAVKALYQEIRD